MNSDLIVIGFSGCARTGKTSSADFAQKHIEQFFPAWGVHRMSFAQPLKEALEIMGVYKDQDYDLYRNMAQQIGTEMLRKYRDSWWVDLMRENIGKIGKGKNIVFIDDVRFPNEAQLISEYQNGYNVFVYGGPNRIDLTQDVYKHGSEKLGVYFENVFRGNEVEEFYTIDMHRSVDSQSNIANLEKSVRAVVEEIMKEVENE